MTITFRQAKKELEKIPCKYQWHTVFENKHYAIDLMSTKETIKQLKKAFQTEGRTIDLLDINSPTDRRSVKKDLKRS